jgi:fatty acid-binding protein DegV
MAIKYLQSEFNASCSPDCKRIYVVHADNTERVNKLVELVKESHPDMDVVVSTLCPVIGAHTGPDMTAVICWK